jgi:hypothetical protein
MDRARGRNDFAREAMTERKKNRGGREYFVAADNGRQHTSGECAARRVDMEELGGWRRNGKRGEREREKGGRRGRDGGPGKLLILGCQLFPRCDNPPSTRLAADIFCSCDCSIMVL